MYFVARFRYVLAFVLVVCWSGRESYAYMIPRAMELLVSTACRLPSTCNGANEANIITALQTIRLLTELSWKAKR